MLVGTMQDEKYAYMYCSWYAHDGLYCLADSGMTPLFIAVTKSHLPIVQYLAQQGADINLAHDDGYSPLDVATINGLTAVANYLREQGAI